MNFKTILMKRYIKIVISVILFSCSFSFSLFAQKEQTKLEKEQEIKSQKIAFFTDKIGLTSEEAQIFWPIYNDYWAKKNKIISDRKQKMTYFAENIDKLNNAEMIKYADQYIHYEMELAELLDEYHIKFKKILPIEKVMKIYLADYEFKAYLLRRISKGDSEDN